MHPRNTALPTPNMFSKSARTGSQNNIPAGFVTEGGSVYIYVDEKATAQRFKVSDGTGKGELRAPSICFFVAPDDAACRNDWHFYTPGFIGEANGLKRFEHVFEPDKLPPGAQLLLVKDRGHERPDIVKASLSPQIGLVVIQKWYNERHTMSTCHKGAKVSEIIPNKQTALHRMIESGKPFGRDGAYFAEIATKLNQATQIT